MNAIYYIGLDIHKKTIAYCIKRIDGELVQQGTVSAERKALQQWQSEKLGCIAFPDDNVNHPTTYRFPGYTSVNHGQEINSDHLVDVCLGKAIEPFPPK